MLGKYLIILSVSSMTESPINDMRLAFKSRSAVRGNNVNFFDQLEFSIKRQLFIKSYNLIR